MPIHKTTALIHSGRHVRSHRQGANPSVVRASTVLFEDVASYKAARKQREANPHTFTYGRYGTPTCFELADAIQQLYGKATVQLYPSGMAAIGHGLTTILSPSSHALVVDTVFEPTRRFLQHLHSVYNITVEYFQPNLEGLEALIRPNTRLILVESPGSITLEVVDIPSLSRIAQQSSIILACDDTYSTGLLSNPFALGVEMVILAGTKYLNGHADVMMGAVICRDAKMSKAVARQASLFGQTLSPDDAYLALRGLRTLDIRIAKHQDNALRLARGLARHPAVERVYHPALPDHVGHEVWKRDFSGSNGLFSVQFKENLQGIVPAFIDKLELFGIGASWGGFESLVVPADVSLRQFPTASRGTLVRFHAGLEEFDDLRSDIEHALEVFAAAV